MMGFRLGALVCNSRRDLIYVYRLFDTCAPLSLLGKLGVELGRDRSQTRRTFLVLLAALSWSPIALIARSKARCYWSEDHSFQESTHRESVEASLYQRAGTSEGTEDPMHE